MSSVQHLREFISQRLTAAAEEIFSEFEKTIVQYEEEIDRQRRLLDISWKPQINFHRVELPRHYLCEEEIPVNLEKDSSLDQEEPEPPQIKEEPVEVCTSHEEQQETDNPTVTLTYEESDRSEAEPTNVQLQDQSQDQEGSGRESTGNAELRPKKRRHSNDGDNSSMSESHRNTAKDLSQQYVCEEEEEEILTDQQFFNHEGNSSLDQQEPEPPQFKEELEESCTSEEEEWLELKQETDILSVTPTHEESELTSDQLLSQNSSVAERQEMEKNLRDEESESTQNAKLKSHKRRGRSINHSNDVINESQFNADTGDQAVICGVCGKAFMSYSELRAHCRMHTELPQHLISEVLVTDQHFYNQEKNSSLDQEEPEELYTYQEEERLLLKEEPDVFIVTSEECEQSERLLSHSQDQESSWHRDPESARNVQLKPKKRHYRHTSQNNTTNTFPALEYPCNTDAGTSSVKYLEGCGEPFENNFKIGEHYIIGADEKLHSCEICKKDFRKRKHLLVHMRIHTGEKPYSCVICAKSFSQNGHLTVHMRTHTGEKPYLCITCGKRFSDSSILKNHMLIHTGEKPFSCGICEKTFRYSSSLTVHMKIHTGEKPYLCKICGKSYRHNSTLIAHMRNHSGEKSYSCKTCSKGFTQSSALMRHERIHTSEKPYSCQTCGKCFRNSSYLNIHTRLHTGEKSYSCTFCGKSFSRSPNLLRHMRSHMEVSHCSPETFEEKISC